KAAAATGAGAAAISAAGAFSAAPLATGLGANRRGPKFATATPASTQSSISASIAQNVTPSSGFRRYSAGSLGALISEAGGLMASGLLDSAAPLRGAWRGRPA